MHDRPGSVLAFDFGTKRIGVAVGTRLGGGRWGEDLPPDEPLLTLRAAF